MTMLDDARLRTLLTEAGAAFEVPPTGAADIVARAAAPDRDAAATVADPSAGEGEGEGEGAGEVEGQGQVPRADRPGRVRHLAAMARRHPLLSAAACVLVALLVAGTVGAVVRTSSPGPTLTSGLPRPAPLVPSHGPSTTIPRLGTAAGGSATSPLPKASGAPQVGAPPNGTQNAAVPSGTAVTPPTAIPLPSGAVGQPAKIVQTGTLGLSVHRGALGHTMTQLNAVAAAYGGFVAGSQTQSGAGTGGAPYGSVTLQVPVDNFSAALKSAQALGKTSSLTTKATDVTSQYIDLQARIAALQASRQQYLTILSKATTVGDVLAVQSQIDAIQSQIEQLQGQLNVLTSQTSYSTLTVTVSEGAPPPRPVPLPESGLVRAWHDSTGGFLDAVEGTIRIAGPALFALLVLAALGLGGRALWRRYQRHNL